MAAASDSRRHHPRCGRSPKGRREREGLAEARRDPLQEPQTTYRVRWNMNTDTPLPPDEPAAPNPPEGAIINYYLKSAAYGPVTLEILAATASWCAGIRARTKCSHRIRQPSTSPLYWFRPLTALSASAGMHRFTWDMHYQPLASGGRIGGPTLPIAAIGHNTVSSPTTPWVNPGQFHGEADGQWQELHAADDRETGSAREDAGAPDAAGVHALEGDLPTALSTRRLRHGRRGRSAIRSPTLRPRASGACGKRRSWHWTGRSRRSSRRLNRRLKVAVEGAVDAAVGGPQPRRVAQRLKRRAGRRE